MLSTALFSLKDDAEAVQILTKKAYALWLAEGPYWKSLLDRRDRMEQIILILERMLREAHIAQEHVIKSGNQKCPDQ
jgi:hypothetical protein